MNRWIPYIIAHNSICNIKTAYTLPDWSVVDTFTSYTLDGNENTFASGIWSFHVNGSGTYIYVVSLTANKVYRYILSTPYDLTTRVLSGEFTPGLSDCRDVSVSPDGTILYILRGFNSINTLYAYSLTTPWDITTAQLINSQYFGPQIASFYITPDGVHLYVDKLTNVPTPNTIYIIISYPLHGTFKPLWKWIV